MPKPLVRLVLLQLMLAAGAHAQSGSGAVTTLGKFCPVSSDAGLYTGKTLLVETRYVVGFEMGWLEDEEPCNPTKPSSIRFEFSENYRKETEPKVLKKFERGIRFQVGKAIPRKVSGVFEISVKPYLKRNPHDHRYEFTVVVNRIVSVDKRRERRK